MPAAFGSRAAERLGYAALEAHAARCSPLEPQPRGVQAHPTHGIAPASVLRIAHDRMADGGQLGADLPAAAGLERVIQHRRVITPLVLGLERYHIDSPPALGS